MEYLELLNKVEQWAKDRALDTVEARTQYTKLIEEQGELGVAIDTGAIDGDSGVIDSLGDYQVTLIIYCLIRGIDLRGKIEKQGKFWTKDVDGMYQLLGEDGISLTTSQKFIYLVYESSQLIGKYNRNKGVAEEYTSVAQIMLSLYDIAREYGTNLEETLNIAYHEIKYRKGKMINGIFVKEADLNGKN
ncbi:MazG-like family protein [Ligilactobacillus salivarius]|uniref:DNA-binding protein n=1 Tax=Ligilactobacillus salivarius TaxID=1624 RepID=A0A1V9QUG4_9LACO|nr:MazG-like family protein [Ligilactobacillus salivarius]OQQ84483.1 hypothetical protein B6U60_04070 [Ligilactobacillus salivarius]OQQ87082.1 hypothetical protein B6U59_04145 [Ligilactobacillus salivarius]